MAKEKKVQAVKAKSQTKHRKGGEKVRKVAPARRLEAKLAQFSDAAAAAKLQRGMREAAQLTAVREDSSKVMDGPTFKRHVSNTNATPRDPRRLVRLLMPNARV